MQAPRAPDRPGLWTRPEPPQQLAWPSCTPWALGPLSHHHHNVGPKASEYVGRVLRGSRLDTAFPPPRMGPGVELGPEDRREAPESQLPASCIVIQSPESCSLSPNSSSQPRARQPCQGACLCSARPTSPLPTCRAEHSSAPHNCPEPRTLCWP
ncbi:uncharacterized protein LOC106505208 isoform X2 [Sus scrofa]|uniref:uncharacterized protein LOC106505208 isoform X2 n=1 Tax=Sus scrofa TaxID=9823 RepID=UPI0006B16F7B|nr:uncharacterized protein LOC106505208 isoform X2 [Sus scrofa]